MGQMKEQVFLATTYTQPKPTPLPQTLNFKARFKGNLRSLTLKSFTNAFEHDFYCYIIEVSIDFC